MISSVIGRRTAWRLRACSSRFDEKPGEATRQAPAATGSGDPKKEGPRSLSEPKKNKKTSENPGAKKELPKHRSQEEKKDHSGKAKTSRKKKRN